MNPVCKGEGCKRKRSEGRWWKRGYCNPCYVRLRTRGLLPLIRKKHWAAWLASDAIRVNANGCEISCASKDAKGYPCVRAGRRVKKLTALVLELKLGRKLKPGTQEVCRHVCHNPECVNMLHLIPGTVADNAGDMMRAERQGRATLNPRSVRLIRALSASGVRRTGISKLFGITEGSVSRIRRRKTWRHVPE